MVACVRAPQAHYIHAELATLAGRPAAVEIRNFMEIILDCLCVRMHIICVCVHYLSEVRASGFHGTKQKQGRNERKYDV